MVWKIRVQTMGNAASNDQTEETETILTYDERRKGLRTELLSMRHPIPPATMLRPELANQFDPFRLYDVAIVHTGEGGQKATLADPMQVILEEGGFRVFLDADMHAGAVLTPPDQMRLALRTSRHIVVILSTEFLGETDPCSELLFSFERMEFIRRQYEWQSLWVVCFNLSIKQFNKLRQTNTTLANRQLPNLASNTTMYEFTTGRYGRFTELCLAVKTDLIAQDHNQKATEKWINFLQEFDDLPERGFPAADWIYPESRSGVVGGRCAIL